jgi:membrane protein
VRVIRNIYETLKLFFKSIVDLIRDNGMVYAAATSFYFLVSFFPVILIIVYVSVSTLNFFYRGVNISEISMSLFKYIKEILPFLPDTLVQEFTRIIRSYKSVGLAGLITLLFSSTAAAESLIQAARTIFNSQKTHYVITKIITIAFVLGIGILLAIFLAITSFVSNLLASNLPSVYKFLSIYKGSLLFSTILPIILIFISYTVITYLIVPVKAGFKRIGRVGIFFTFFFMLAKILYGFYLKNITKMTIFYGSISALVILVLWVFYITTLYLVSLEIIKNMSSNHSNHR